MADIAKCHGTAEGVSCEHRDKCYRYTAPANPLRQTYFTMVPVDEGGHCEYFWMDDLEEG